MNERTMNRNRPQGGGQLLWPVSFVEYKIKRIRHPISRMPYAIGSIYKLLINVESKSAGSWPGAEELPAVPNVMEEPNTSAAYPADYALSAHGHG